MRKSALLLLLAALALPALGANRVTVEQLEKTVAAAQGRPDREVAQSLGNLELTERLSRARLERLRADLHGEKARLALLALADASAFLDLPAADIPPGAAPDSTTQGQIISRAEDFVIATVSKMPDFFATRTTTRFQDMKVFSLFGDPIFIENQSFQFIDRLITPVTYRNGREVLEAPGAKRRGSSVTSTTGLTTWGVFGPLLGVVMADILKGKVGWGHWEQGPAGLLAVFRYTVPEDRSNYTVRYCCFRSGQGEMREFEAIPAYHGEIAIDPASGAVLRLVLKTDLQPELPMERADVLVEYGPVEIGGRTYICPVTSTSISRAETVVLHGSQFYADKKTKPDGDAGDPANRTEAMSGPKLNAINDVVFENYHRFRGEVTIVPAEGAEPGGSEPAFVPAPSPKKRPTK
jgi:hypothetical protein